MFRLIRQVLEWSDNQNDEMTKSNPISLNYPHLILRTQFFLEFVKIRKFNCSVSSLNNSII